MEAEDDNVSTATSETAVRNDELREQRDVEAEVQKQEEQLKEKAKGDVEKISREDLLRKLKMTMKQSSMYAELLFDRLTQPPEELLPKRKGRGGRKKKAPAKTKKSSRLQDSASSQSQEKPGETASSSYISGSQPDIADDEISCPKENKEDTVCPALFTGGQLRSYQVTGLKWLASLHYNGINGILADEMGLGKTIQVIALICYLIEKNATGPFLVAGPLSTVYNWTSEFHRFAPEVPVVRFHGNKQKREELKADMKLKRLSIGKTVWPVFVTSYEMLLYERKWMQSFGWSYFVLDEGHRIKNTKCLLLSCLKEMYLAGRLILTGTPLQNNLTELWSLLNFIIPEVFNNLECWIRDAKEAEVAKTDLIGQIHEVLKPFLLRRLKCDVELGITLKLCDTFFSLVGLPPKKEILVYAPLTPWQQEMYTAALSRGILGFFGKGEEQNRKMVGEKRRKTEKVDYSLYFENDSLEKYDVALQVDRENNNRLAGHSSKLSYENISSNRIFYHPKTGQKMFLSLNCIKSIIVMLRKITMHPYLLCCPMSEDNSVITDEDLVRESGKMMVLDRLLKPLKERGHKVLLFSQYTMMIDLIEDYCCHLRGFTYCRLDGSRDLEDRQASIDRFNSDSECFLFLISTRAGGLGINLAAADTVIIYDSDWNPQVDLQAQDRCHRIGQERPVITYRLTGRGTIDEEIIRRATNKRRLEKMVIHSKRFKAKREEDLVSPEELLNLLKSTDYSETLVAAAEGAVISDEDLERLLDRSRMKEGLLEDAEVGDEKDRRAAFKVIGNEVNHSGF